MSGVLDEDCPVNVSFSCVKHCVVDSAVPYSICVNVRPYGTTYAMPPLRSVMTPFLTLSVVMLVLTEPLIPVPIAQLSDSYQLYAVPAPDDAFFTVQSPCITLYGMYQTLMTLAGKMPVRRKKSPLNMLVGDSVPVEPIWAAWKK